MSFKVTPVTKRKVHYSSITWDFNDPTTIENDYPIPNDSTAVSITIEVLETPVPTAGAPVVFIDTSDGGALAIIAPSTYNTNQIIELPPNTVAYFPKRASGNLSIVTVGSFTQGKYIVTVGYFKSGKYAYL